MKEYRCCVSCGCVLSKKGLELCYEEKGFYLCKKCDVLFQERAKIKKLEEVNKIRGYEELKQTTVLLKKTLQERVKRKQRNIRYHVCLSYYPEQKSYLEEYYGVNIERRKDLTKIIKKLINSSSFVGGFLVSRLSPQQYFIRLELCSWIRHSLCVSHDAYGVLSPLFAQGLVTRRALEGLCYTRSLFACRSRLLVSHKDFCAIHEAKGCSSFSDWIKKGF
jgi:hypothetical protein